MRQYWRDFDALERRARSLPHKQWCGRFLRDSAGTGFWHETYFLRGGIETNYADIPTPLGLLAFAQARPATGALFSARRRAGLEGQELAPVVTEAELDQRFRNAEPPTKRDSAASRR